VRFNDLVALVEDIPPPPPAIVSKANDTKLTFDDIFNFIQSHEGTRPTMYLDSRKIPTIGIGFNLTRADAPALLKSIGADYNLIMAKKQSLTSEQIKQLFQANLQVAYKDAKQYLPGFDGLPKQIKLVILDLSFNLGLPGLSKFVKFKAAIQTGNYAAAARELATSKWASQVGNRANKLINIISSFS